MEKIKTFLAKNPMVIFAVLVGLMAVCIFFLERQRDSGASSGGEPQWAAWEPLQ
ncbi:MAG: hypothetical protein ACYDDI_17550 [Candidatus Acidiferrales bacterium]